MGPPGVPGVPISGPNRGIFSKLNGPGPLGYGGHSHTSFSNCRFRVAQRTLQYDVVLNLDFRCLNKSIFQLMLRTATFPLGVGSKSIT